MAGGGAGAAEAHGRLLGGGAPGCSGVRTEKRGGVLVACAMAVPAAALLADQTTRVGRGKTTARLAGATGLARREEPVLEDRLLDFSSELVSSSDEKFFRTGGIDAVITEDSDLIAYGCQAVSL
ncbi:hypothetical protein J5N97_001046 [Dioscorea zingiberensis]|uniref:Exonuclease 1 n=1 Tax=Dioscorea zingiberensis TaxID=325984 RepID=A0A9D5BUL7_9LILI|nr:hypothetical protein J5N97_001046 [Dioscorea zingiberensis]